MTNVEASTELSRKLSLLWPWLNAASFQAVEVGTPREFYPEYLREMYGISRAAVPLMEAAIRSLRGADPQWDMTDELVEYYERHIEEERSHDVWILEDLGVLGYESSWTTDRQPSIWVASLVGAAFYWVELGDPCSLLGYLKVMESSHPTVESVTSLQERSGFPPSAFRCMRHHAEEDPDHKRDIDVLIDLVATTDPRRRAIQGAALHTAELLLHVLTNLDSPSRTTT